MLRPIHRFVLRSYLFTASWLLATLAALLTGAAGADELPPSGSPFQVNTYTTGDQEFPDVGRDANGNFVLVWEGGAYQDGDYYGIFGQRYSADGAPVGDEFQVNTYTTEVQFEPAVAFGPNGEYIVVWQSYSQDGSRFGIFGQRYDSAGMEVGDEFAVNSYTTNDQEYPDVAIDANGQFLVVWESDGQDQSFAGIYAQHYDSAGTEIGSEFQIHTTTIDEQNDPAVVATSDGFLVVWESDMVDASGEAVVMQFLDANADPVGGEVQVNTSEASDQEDPDVALLPDGTFAVVWESDGQDGDGESVVAQVLGSDGVPVGSEILLNTSVTGDQDDPRLAADGVDGFLAVWSSPSPGNSEVWGRRFDSTGQAVGDEFQINLKTASDQDNVAVAGGAPGRFVVTWRSFGGQDGSGTGVFARRYERAFFADGFESGNTSAWSDVVP